MAKLELAHWDTTGEKRGRFMREVNVSRLGELTMGEEGAEIPLVPPLTKSEIASLPWPSLKRVSLFTFTTKMSCASFSIGAGPVKSHGTCLAANLSKEAAIKRSMDVEREGGFSDSQAAQQIGHRGPTGVKSIPEEKSTGMYICDACYAGKSRYSMYSSIQVCQYIRQLWADRALARGTFVDEMVSALGATLGDQRLMTAKLASSRHFRIHDAGDFYSMPYMMAWFEVCRKMPSISFWVPTRMWVAPEFREAMRRAPKNLALRPSALFYGVQAPMVVGLGAGSAAGMTDLPNHWTCPTYLSVEHSCASANCRTCWERVDVPVVYRTH